MNETMDLVTTLMVMARIPAKPPKCDGICGTCTIQDCPEFIRRQTWMKALKPKR